MLDGRNLVVDTFSEVYKLLKPWITHDFWNFAEHTIVDNSVYVISRKQFQDNANRIRYMLGRQDITVFFDNAAEGSWTLISQLKVLGFDAAARQRQLLLIGGGDMEDTYVNVQYDHFLANIIDYDENVDAMSATEEIFSKKQKPYQFLFLNGRARPHRKYLFERFRESGLLDQALWTMLDSRPSISRSFKFDCDGTNVMATTSPLQWLPRKYEYTQYRDVDIQPGPPERTFVKHDLFRNEWGEVYLEPAPYIDTYFSLVTETVYEYPYSFRTEKIAKPLMIGHPFIVAASRGYYRDLQNLGFKTFDHVIDERFDQIDNHQDRMDRIIDIVNSLCSDNLDSFISECYSRCKYNQQHLLELSPRLKSQFPQKFFKTLQQHHG